MHAKCDFCVSVCKTNFTDHHTPDTIHGFRDSVLVCKMHDCYCIPRHQAIQTMAIIRLACENKTLQNAFKRI